MKRKTLNVLLAMILAMSLSLVAAIPAGAAPVALSATEGSGDEDRIEVALPTGFTLGDLESVSWSVYASEGYPPHLDITLEGVPVNESMLTAEMAYNNAEGKELDEGLTPTLGQWLQTFELSLGDGYGEIDDGTMFWVTKMGAGNDDAPSGTLAQWKDGIVGADPDGELAATAITSSTVITKLEIEVDNWVINSVAIVDGIVVMGTGGAVGLGVIIETPAPEPDIVAISVTPTSIDFGTLYPGQSSGTTVVTVENIGTVAIDVNARVEPTLTVFDNLLVGSQGVPTTALITGLAGGASDDVDVQLVVLSEYLPEGAETATLVFEAVATP